MQMVLGKDLSPLAHRRNPIRPRVHIRVPGPEAETTKIPAIEHGGDDRAPNAQDRETE